MDMSLWDHCAVCTISELGNTHMVQKSACAFLEQRPNSSSRISTHLVTLISILKLFFNITQYFSIEHAFIYYYPSTPRWKIFVLTVACEIIWGTQLSSTSPVTLLIRRMLAIFKFITSVIISCNNDLLKSWIVVMRFSDLLQ